MAIRKISRPLAVEKKEAADNVQSNHDGANFAAPEHILARIQQLEKTVLLLLGRKP